MGYIRWLGLVACSIAGVGYLSLGRYGEAGLILALAAICLINTRRLRGRRKSDDERGD